MYVKEGRYTIIINGKTTNTKFFSSESEHDNYVDEVSIQNSESYLRVETQYIK